MRFLPQMISCLALCCGALSGFAAIVIETSDGLPVEVEVVSVYRDDLIVRHTASQREAQLKLSQLGEESRKKVSTVAGELRAKVDEKAFRFDVRLEENPAKEKPKIVNLMGDGGLEVSSVRGKEKPESSSTHEIPPGSVALRIAGATNCGADVTLDAKVFWFYRGGERGVTANSSENFKINVVQSPQEMITRSPSFARSEYQGYALVIVNPTDKKVLWKRGSSTSFLNEANKLLEASEK